MQINVVGILVDPLGNPLGNHEIRITSKESTLNSVETTDLEGNYSFILTDGWHYVEVLFKGKYLIVGDALVDDSTPTPVNLNDLLEYSTPIEPEDIFTLPTEYQSLQDTLENSSLVHYREQRSQLVNPLTHKLSLLTLYESNDGNERSMGEVQDLTSCDATVQSQNQVYTDSEGNTYSVTSSKQATKHVVKLDSSLLSDTYDEEHSITLDTYTESTSKLITPTGSVTTVSLTHGGTSKLGIETINDSGVSSNTNTTSTLGTLTENQAVLNSQLNLSKSFEEVYKDSFTYDGSTSTKEYSSIIEDKEVSVTFTNTGSSTQGSVIVDNFTIGRESNRTFEVDSINNRVTVRGALRITDLEDEDGNPITIPEDGNTIFQVFQYGETSSGPWEDTIQSYHTWKRENTSVNGYIDPNGWSLAYKFIGEDVVGDPGDTIYYEYNYSPDGNTDWTFAMKAGDAFRRERRVVNGTAEDWSDPVRIKGTDGDEIEIRSQYSVDGVTNWHDTFVDGDIYERRARFVNGLIDSPWSDPFRIVGSSGDDGIPGLNGSGWYSIVGNSGVWPGDTQATTDFINTFGRVPQLDDHLFYVDQDPDPTKTEGRRCVTPVGESPIQWNNPRAYFDGDVIVKGTLSADRLVAQSITGNEIDSQTTIIAGSGSTTAGMNGYDLATLPDWMGGGSNPYVGYRFWAGATTPEFANFTVDDTGRMKAVDGTFSGTITLVGTNGLKVESSTPFGPHNLLEWRGSVTGKLDGNGDVVLDTLTKLNAVSYYSDNNEAYFGGTLIAGTLTTSAQNPSINSNVEISTGTFGSNGGQIIVVCSMSSNGNTGLITGDCSISQDTPEVILRLYQVDGTNEIFVKQESFTGFYNCSPEGGGQVIKTGGVSGSFSYYDNANSTEDREYIIKAEVSNMFGNISQRLSIVTQEA